MAHARRFRFGVQFMGAASREEWRQKVRRAEELGYNTVCLSDHFGDQFAPIAGLMAAADATQNVRIGACLLDNDFRHPVVLAKEAATLDLLSGGRLELGIGAGWMKVDYDASGIAYDPPGVRIDKLEESLRVLKGLLGPDTLDFEGQHYQVHLKGFPRPVQTPHPPIFLGGGGRRMLSMAGRQADIVGINLNLKGGAFSSALGPDTTADITAQKVAWVREAAAARYADIEMQIIAFVAVVTPHRDQVAANVGPQFGVSAEAVRQMPYALIGTVDEIVADLEARRERYDFSYVTVGENAMEAFAPVVQRLAGR